MRKEIIPIPEESSNYMERLFLEYGARKDILVTLFESHKFDNDFAVLESQPFKHYEKLFAESKLAYETGLRMIEEQFVPKEFRKPSNNFIVNFEENALELMINE